MKKKWLGIALAALMAAAMPLGAVCAEETDSTPDFSDDFESYEAGDGTVFVEDLPGFAEKWSNDVLKTGDKTADTECVEVASVIAEPGNESNKVLHISNWKNVGSFFYVGPKDLRVKNFELTFRLKAMRATDRPWFGIAMRKELNVRFNGANQIMMYVRTNEKNFELNAQRGYAGSAGDLSDTLKGSASDGGARQYEAEAEGHTAVIDQWHTFKFVANEGKFTVSVDDFELGYLEYSKASVMKHGYVSIDACIQDFYLDDFQLTNLDTEPAPPIEEDPGEEDPPATDEPEPSPSVAPVKPAEEPGNTGLIIGLSIGGAVVVLGGAALAVVLVKRKKKG